MLPNTWFKKSRRAGVPDRHRVRLALEALEERLPPTSAQTIASVVMVSSPSNIRATPTTTEAVFAVTPNGGLNYFNGTSWTPIGGAGTIRSVAAVMQVPRVPAQPVPVVQPDPVAFVITSQGGLARYDTAQGRWQQIGGNGSIAAMSAGVDSKGLADVFVITTGRVMTEWTNSGGWLASPIGGAGSILDMSATNGGRVDVVTADHSLFRFDPGAGWQRLSGAGFASSVAAVDSTDYVVTMNGGLVEMGAGGTSLIGGAGTIRTISAGTDTFNRPEVFVITSNGAFDEFSAQNGWQTLGAPNTIAQMSAAGNDIVFAIASDGSVQEHSGSTGWIRISGPGFGQT